MGQGERNPIAVLLLNLGGPDSLSAVRPFLFNLFSDREIIRLGPSFLQKPIACLIALLRSGKTQDAYSLIGGRSPINDLTMAQAAALEKQLNSQVSGNQSHVFRVFVGMRYWRPFLADALGRIYGEGIRRVIALTMYPHYSVATTGSSLSNLREVLQAYPEIKACTIESWYDHPMYIEALVESIERGLRVFMPSQAAPASSKPDVHLLFSAHSLPVRFINEGDPYADHIMATIRAVTDKVKIPWSLSFQSKSGPVEWLSPSTEEMLEELSSKGVRNLLVVPVSFVSDHIETLYEIDILYKNMAAGLGMRLERTESLNLSSAFISALRDISVKCAKESGWDEQP